MKKLCLFAVLIMAVGFSYAQSVTFSSAMPEPGKPLSFEYNPVGGSLEKLTNVSCYAYTFFSRDTRNSSRIKLEKIGSTYKGEYTPADSASLVVLLFSADGTRDENPKGYFTKMYKDGKPTAMAIFMEGFLYAGFGNALAKMTTDNNKALSNYALAFKTDPNLKTKYLNNYLLTQYSIDKVAGEKLVNETIAANNKKAPTEENLLQNASLFYIIKKQSSADSIHKLLLTKYPKGRYALGRAINEMYTEKDIAKKEEKFNAIPKNFNLDLTKKSDLAKISIYYPTMANAFAAAKNNEKFEFYSDKIESKTDLAAVYNSYAWASAEAKGNLPFATKISKKSLELIEAAKKDPLPAYFSSQKEYEENLNSSYSSYADTYAVLLSLQGKYAEALAFQEEAVNKNKFSNAEMNARYVNFLAKNGQNEKVVTFAERFIKEGQGTAQMKSDLQAAYKGPTAFDVYYAALEKEANEKEKAKWMKEMINIPAPTFALVNLQGEKVDLAKLKGKVVIVDYWATWCGPCMASFPGMQKAVDKYKNDPDVVFLFINTWQTEENREKVVKDWLASTKYTFNILLDTKNKDDKFDVIEQYKVDGIPTKFVVDGNGNIRFKKVGFGGTADGTVKELDIMIEMAKAASGKPQSK